ncbi:hypothetical protein ACFL5O_10390 [Myxococcota bacterium]
MRGTPIRSTLMIGIFVAAVGCGAGTNSARQAAAPEPTQVVEPAGDDEEAETAGLGQEMDVGMSFEDTADDADRSDRTPPPTQAWKPLAKEQPGKMVRTPANR